MSAVDSDTRITQHALKCQSHLHCSKDYVFIIFDCSQPVSDGWVLRSMAYFAGRRQGLLPWNFAGMRHRDAATADTTYGVSEQQLCRPTCIDNVDNKQPTIINHASSNWNWDQISVWINTFITWTRTELLCRSNQSMRSSLYRRQWQKDSRWYWIVCMWNPEGAWSPGLSYACSLLSDGMQSQRWTAASSNIPVPRSEPAKWQRTPCWTGTHLFHLCGRRWREKA